MTRTSRFTLIATVLLGVLLYTITRFAADLNIAWDGSAIAPPPDVEDATAAPIADAANLRAVLNALDIDPATVLDSWAAWSDARGFVPPNRLFGIPDPVDPVASKPATSNFRPANPAPANIEASDPAPSDSLPADRGAADPVASGPRPSVPEASDTGSAIPRGSADNAAINEAELLARSTAGDAEASQALAARAAFTAPFEAIEYYRLAAEQGSTFALLRLASLFEALDTVAQSGVAVSPDYVRRVAALTGSATGNDLRRMAFTHLLAAIRDGGPPIVDPALLAWVRRLDEQVTADQRTAVCAQSARLLMEIAGRRVRMGRPPVVTEAPPIFFTARQWADRQLCGRTADPIESLMDLSHCTVTGFRTTANEPLDLYICAVNAEQRPQIRADEPSPDW